MNKILINSSFVLLLVSYVGIAQSDVLEYEKVVQSIIDYECDIEDLKKDASYLTTRLGSKLTGSKSLIEASHYIESKAKRLGLESSTERISGAIDFSWENKTTKIAITSPYYFPLSGIPIAWTEGTYKAIECDVLFLKAEDFDLLGNPFISNEKLENYKDLLKGKILVMHEEVHYETDSSILLNRLNTDYFKIEQIQKSSFTTERLSSMIKAMAEKEHEFNESLKSFGVRGIIVPSQRNHGIIRGHGSFSGMFEKYNHPLPNITVSSPEYNRLLRLVKNGRVGIEIEVYNEFLPGAVVQNTFVDLKGSQNPNETIILGAHLDTWHLSDGATDNIAGVLILLEAINILKSLDLELFRSVKLAFWSGEEQGLLGSTSWVASNKLELDKISAYLNVDAGTGKIRGITNQLNESAIKIFESAFEPLKSIGVIGVKRQYEIGSDYMPFNEAGVPAFHFKQDPIDYYQRTHHTNLDTYEYLRFDEIIQAAKVVAATSYYIANMTARFNTQ